jgi:hypothetical protein
VSLGQKQIDALRDVASDFWGGQPLDPGFDQLLRTTDAGAELRRALGLALAADADFVGPLELEAALADVASSGSDFVSFAVTGGNPASPLGITVKDASGRQTSTLSPGPAGPPSDVPGAALLRLGTEANAPVLGVVPAATGGPYSLDLRSTVDTVVDVSITLPKGDGTFVRAEFSGVDFPAGTIARVSLDPLQPDQIVFEKEGVSVTRAGSAVPPQGPQLVSATVIGPETLQGASPFGFQLVALFDRVVDPDSAAQKENYEIPKNGIQGAKSQLSGRLVFISLEQPEGGRLPGSGQLYVPTTFRVVGGLLDSRGTEGPSGTVDLGSRLEDPGAVVSGHVFQADGTPVTSGTVIYVNNSNTACVPQTNETGFAALPLDSEGHYEFRYVRQDNCGTPFKIVTVDPATGARRQASAFVRAAGEAITLDLALFGRGAVQGTVRNVNGDAVPGASVVAYSQTDPQIGGVAATDGLGHYFIDGITVGAIVVKAGKGAALGSKAGRIDQSGATATVDIVLDGEAASVHGTVYKVEGDKQDAVPGVYVLFKHFSSENPFGQTLGATTTDDKGDFAFDGVPVGHFEVSAALNQRDHDAKQGDAIAGTTTTQNLTIVIPAPTELATVSGQVFMPDQTTPAQDVVVSIGGRGVVSADGSFTIEGVAVSNGAQTVRAQSRDGRRSGSTTVVANQAKLYPNLTIVLSGLGNAAFRVLDEKGQPVKGQQVGLLGQCGNPCGCAVATTDQDGIAVFQNLSYGQFSAKAIRSTSTFTDVAQGSLSIVADDTTVLTTMRFAGAGTVQGTVRDPATSPVFGADVLLYAQRFVYDGASSCGLQYGYAGRARTGLDGTYGFKGINLGAVSVSATQDFFSSAVGNRGTLDEPGQVLTLDMAFADTTAGILSGTVFLPGDAGPAGAGVEVAVEGPLPEVKVTTDAEGHFEFAHILPEGYYTLTARDPVGGGLARLSVTLKRQQDLQKDVTLKGRGSVRVRVVAGPDDEPVESALVRLTEKEYPARTFDQSVRPGNDGTVLFLDVYEGPLKIQVTDPFARSASVDAVLPGPGQELPVQVKVNPTGRVTGRFLMPDALHTPIPYGTVTLKAGGKVVGQTTAIGSGSDVGRYSFDYVPVGPITLDAQDPATARVGSASGILDHEGDPPFELDVIAQGLGEVHGYVKRGTANQALARVVISSGSYRSTTLTDGNGYYEVDGVPEGRVTVTASLNDQGFLAGSNSAALEGDGQSIQIDVTLRDAGSVAGRIVPASEEDRAAGRYPASEVRLYVGGTGGGSQETSTRPDGTFSFDVVPAGHVTFTADVLNSIDHGSATLDVVPGENTVEIPLQGVGRLRGQGVASDAPGAPGVDGWISFSGSAFPYGATVRLGNDGAFELPEVLAGDFTARLQHGQGALALYGQATGTVTPGEETTVVVALQPSGEIQGSVFRPAPAPEGKRAAFGAEVTIVLAKGGTIPLLAQEDGSFAVKGVPQGDFLVRVFDPVSNGRAVAGDLHLTGNLTVVPEILIDDSAPVVSFVQPVPGSIKSALGGLLVLEVTPETAGDVDPASASVTYPGLGAQGSLAWDPGIRRFTGALVGSWLKIGANTLVASVKDLSGNVGQAEVSWTVTGGTVTGYVRGGDGHTRDGATVKLGALQTTSDSNGKYTFSGLRPAQYCAKATDPDTGVESPQQCGTLADGEELVLADLLLPAAGRLDGTVFHKGGTSKADGVSITWSNRSDVTKNGGQFDLGLVPVGTYSLAANAPNGDVGSGSATVAEGASAGATITLNGVGQVEVTVLGNGSPTPIANASVSVSSSAPFPRSHSGKKTGANGEPVTYDQVLSGTITATASAFGLGGETSGFLDDGKLLQLTITLEPAGRISGIVTKAEDGSGAGGVSVHLTGPKNTTVTSEPDTGAFAFENVPFGHFSLSVSTPEGDFGGTEGDLSAANPDVDASFTLNGLGTVSVHVKDADGDPVSGAHVTVTSQNRSSSADADENGTATVASVRAAASVHVTATHPTTGAKGDKDDGPLAAGGSLETNVALERLGTVSGIVYAPDGQTERDDVAVRLSGSTPVITHDGGQFSFTNRKLGTYTLTAYVDGRLRAQASVALNGPQATQNLVLVGVGTVSGTVTRSGSVPVVDASVRLVSDAPTYGGYFDTTSVTNGYYEIQGVPIGAFTVTATSGADSRQGNGTIQSDGDQVTVNLDLLDSAITLPSTLTDGNDLDWTISPNGSVRRGATFPNGEGTPRLTVIREGTSVSFTGPDCPSGVKCAPTEEDKREVVLSQVDLLGLEATRKLFVPVDGYFMRLLDFLHNPTADPVTVSVLREARVGGTTLVGDASGDGVVGSDDDWVAIDDDKDDDVYRSSNVNGVVAPTALVLSGPGRAASAALVATQPAANRTLLAQTWEDVTIQPGQTVAFLSLFSSQADRGRAVASAQRLVQLPPEVLAGLTPEEAAEIVNFAVPADLVSAVAPLPPTDGVVSGRVLASDGQTPPDAGSSTSVEFRSRSPYYGQPFTMLPQSSAPGVFTFERTFTPYTRLVPREDFDLTATATPGNAYHPFAVPPVAASVTFPAEGVIDLTNVAGRVLRVSSSSGNSWQVPEQAVDDDVSTSWRTAQGDAANQGKTPFFEIGLPGAATVHEVRIRGTRDGDNVSIHAGRIDLTDVSGTVLWSQDVSLPLVSNARDTDVTVPSVAGVRNVRFTSTDDRSASPGLAELRVLGAADLGPAREAKQDLVFHGTGMLEVTVKRSGGSPVPGSWVWLSDGTQTSNAYSTSVDALGTFRWRVLPPGTYTVFARHPAQSPVISVGGVIVAADAEQKQDLVFDPFGAITGTVTTAKLGPIRAPVRLEAAGFPTRSTNSSATDGSYGFDDVPPGTYTLTVTDNRTGFALVRTVSVVAGSPQEQNFTLRPVTTIAVTATFGSPGGPPVPSASTYVEEEPGAGFRFVGYVSNGHVQATVTGPTVTVRVQAGNAQLPSIGEAQATFDEGDPVQLQVVVPGLGTITGQVIGRDGKVVTPVYSLKARVADPDDPSKAITAAVAADGSFELDSVPVRPLLLRSEVVEVIPGCCYGYSLTEIPVALSAHEETLPRVALASIGDISEPGRMDAWEIRPAADAVVSLLLEGRAHGGVTAMADPLLEVYAPDGTPVAANDNRNASDKNSQVTFTATGDPCVVLARGAKGSTGSYFLAATSENENNVFRPWSGRLFTGHVTRLEDGAPAPGQGVRLLRRGATQAEDVVLISLAAGPDGAFSFPGLWSGSLALEAIDSQGVALARREFDVAPGGDPGALDIVVPVHGTVTVHVVRGLDAVPGVDVEVESARTDVLPGDKIRHATTDETGSVSVSMPVGPVAARATDPARPGSSPVEVTGTADETVPASLAIDFGVIRVDVFGYVTNPSQTPLPGATVEIVGFGTSAPTGADGFYRFTNVPGGKTWQIKATHPKAASSQTFDLVLGDQNVERNFALPVPILNGRVVEPGDDSGVEGAQVKVCGGYYYDYACLPTTLTAGDGGFIFTGRPSWSSTYATITVTLLDGSNLTASAYNVPFYYYTTGTVTQDVTLPTTGTVRGMVMDHDDRAVPGAVVALSFAYDWGSYEVRSGVADGNGEYQFPHVQVSGDQPVRVYAESPEGDPGENRGTLQPGQVLPLDVSLVEGAELRITLEDEAGAPLSGDVTVQALLAPGRDGGVWSRGVSLMEASVANVHVPVGPFRVIHDDPPYDPGATEGELGSGQSLAAPVKSGSHVRQPQTLAGDVGSYTTDEHCGDAGCGPFAQTIVAGLREGFPPYVRLEAGGRGLRSLQLAGVGLRVRRQQYVPPSGAFARTLTVLENKSDQPMPLVPSTTLRVSIGYDLNGSFGVGDPFGVVLDGGGNLLALVVGSRLAASQADFRPPVDYGEGTEPGALETYHVLTIEPHKTVAFLTYSLAATDGDLDALDAKAAALVDLSYPDALAGLTAEERAAIVNFDVPPLGDVQGTVSYGGSGVAGAEVGLVDGAGDVLTSTTTGEAGSFRLEAVPPGSYSAAAFDPASGRRGRVAVDVVAGSVSPAAIELLDDAALGSVHVHAVWEGSVEAVADAELTLQAEGFGPVGQTTLVTDQDGYALFTGIPAGSVTVRWPDFYRGHPGTVTVIAGQSAELSISAPPPGNVSGRVTGAGGTVPVPYARVEALDVATGDLLASGTADDAGAYAFSDLRAGAPGFRVRATWWEDPGVQAERTGSVSQPYETIENFDLDLPVAVVTGQVLFDGGAPAVPYPTVFVTQTGVADPRTYYADQSTSGGMFSVFVGGLGSYVVTGQDNDSGLTGTASAAVTNVATGAQVPVVLQPSGSVTVTGGADISGAQVALSSLGLAFDRFGTADGLGVFTFDRVALGPFRVQAAGNSGTDVRGAASGQLAAAGEFSTVPITLPQTTTLDGQILGTRYGYADVFIRSLENDGPLGPANFYAWGNGNYSVEVPVGLTRVGALDYDTDPPAAGLADGTVEKSDSPARIDVTIGNAAVLPANLTGSDGFRYRPDCGGTLTGGGLSDGNQAYWGAEYVYLADRDFPWSPCLPAATEQNGRQIVIGPRDVVGVEMTRKVYVPPSGGFARYLDILTNPGGTAVTVPVYLETELASDTSTRILAAPASTGHTYALTDSTECCRPVLGHVFAGPGGRVGVTTTHFDAGDYDVFYIYTVTIGAGETVVLMHFDVQRGRQDEAGARQQAEALVNLTDPHALDGMTPEERSQVVNFDVP